jgi:hypothetical protein
LEGAGNVRAIHSRVDPWFDACQGKGKNVLAWAQRSGSERANADSKSAWRGRPRCGAFGRPEGLTCAIAKSKPICVRRRRRKEHCCGSCRRRQNWAGSSCAPSLYLRVARFIFTSEGRLHEQRIFLLPMTTVGAVWPTLLRSYRRNARSRCLGQWMDVGALLFAPWHAGG